MMNSKLNKVNQWLINNRLTLNVDKSCFILFSDKKNVTSNISISGKEIRRNSQVKYLGILIDENLNWKPQIDQTLIKLNQGTGTLRKLGYLLDPDCLRSHIALYNQISYIV